MVTKRRDRLKVMAQVLRLAADAQLSLNDVDWLHGELRRQITAAIVPSHGDAP